MAWWEDALRAVDPGNLRYGMPTADKEVLARQGSLPGAPRDTSADQAAADRYASAFLFAKEHPTLSSVVQPLVDRVKTSDLPFFGGDSPELQSFAQQGANRGRQESEKPPLWMIQRR